MDTIRNITDYLILVLAVATIGGLVFYGLLPLAFTDKSLRKDIHKLKAYFAHRWSIITRYGTELGGYVHDTAMSQFISPGMMHFVTGTWSDAAGTVAGTIAKAKAAAAETTVINIPIIIPSNSVALKGSYLQSVEIDYQIQTSALTSFTLTMNKVTRGTDTNGLTVASVTGTQTLTPASTAATVAKHRDKFTITTPFWIDNDEEVFLVATAVCAAGSVLHINGAVANYTARL